MGLYAFGDQTLDPIEATTFEAEGLKERDAQNVLRDHPEAMGDGLFIVAEEYGHWEDSHRRIDLLAIDRERQLIVIELKRTTDGGHMELQALRYAAMVANMTVEQLVEAHQEYLGRRGHAGDARARLLEFLEVESLTDLTIQSERPHILLVSNDFSREVTTSVMWLNEAGLDIRCIRMRPYRHGTDILLDVAQVLPLPEAQDYMVRVRAKGAEVDAATQAKQIWTEARFFEVLRANVAEDVVAVERATYDWLGEHADYTAWGTGAQDGSYWPCYQAGDETYWPVALRTSGKVEVNFANLKRHGIYRDEAARERFRQGLNRIPGVELGPDAIERRPKFELALLAPPEGMAAFKAALEALKQEVGEADPDDAPTPSLSLGKRTLPA